MAANGWDDTGSFPSLSPAQLRMWGTALAGLCGAGVGVTFGLAWVAFSDGDTAIGIAIVALSVLIAGVMVFLILQARVIAQLLEVKNPRHSLATIERRLLAVELEIGELTRSDPAGVEADLPTG